jgi:hypothetical protein
MLLGGNLPKGTRVASDPDASDSLCRHYADGSTFTIAGDGQQHWEERGPVERIRVVVCKKNDFLQHGDAIRAGRRLKAFLDSYFVRLEPASSLGGGDRGGGSAHQQSSAEGGHRQEVGHESSTVVLEWMERISFGVVMRILRSLRFLLESIRSIAEIGPCRALRYPKQPRRERFVAAPVAMQGEPP